MFSVFTQDFGRLELYARALRKMDAKLRGGLDWFYWSEVEFVQGKNRKTVTDARTVFKAPAIRVIARIAEVLDGALKGEEKDSALFALLQETVAVTQEAGFAKEALLYWYFVWNLFAQQGRSPQLAMCASCKGLLRSKALYFSFTEGGALCSVCVRQSQDAIATTPEAIKVLRLILERDWPKLSRLKLDPSFNSHLRALSDQAVAQLCT